MTELATNVELRPTDELIPYSNNPKEHPQGQIDKIASSVQRFGWDQPVVVDANGTIIKGHGRYQAAQKLGLDKVPVIEHTDLSDAEARAARIADNRVAESGWNDDLLSTELELLDESPMSLEATGMDDGEVDSLIGDVPDFEPVPEGEQPRLDETNGDAEKPNFAECPECGHHFEP